MSIETCLPVVIPDQIAPLIGWRGWLVLPHPQGACLWSIVYPQAWPAGRATIAGCPHRAWRHPISERCTCGIYAAHHLEDVVRHLVAPPADVPVRFAVGEVALWGRVIEGEHGVRASHAYPQRLILLDADGSDDAELLTPHLARYGVPVTHGRLRDLTA